VCDFRLNLTNWKGWAGRRSKGGADTSSVILVWGESRGENQKKWVHERGATDYVLQDGRKKKKGSSFAVKRMRGSTSGKILAHNSRVSSPAKKRRRVCGSHMTSVAAGGANTQLRAERYRGKKKKKRKGTNSSLWPERNCNRGSRICLPILE